MRGWWQDRGTRIACLAPPPHAPCPGRGARAARRLVSTIPAHAGLAASAPLPLLETPLHETIAVVLIVLWLLGLVTSYTMGGFIHVLLVIALIVIVLRVIRGNRV